MFLSSTPVGWLSHARAEEVTASLPHAIILMVTAFLLFNRGCTIRLNLDSALSTEKVWKAQRNLLRRKKCQNWWQLRHTEFPCHTVRSLTAYSACRFRAALYVGAGVFISNSRGKSNSNRGAEDVGGTQETTSTPLAVTPAGLIFKRCVEAAFAAGKQTELYNWAGEGGSVSSACRKRQRKKERENKRQEGKQQWETNRNNVG